MQIGQRTLEQIKYAITNGNTFMFRLPHGGMIARYQANDAVYLLTRHGIRKLPQQGSDLCWLLTSLEEDESPLGENAAKDDAA